MHLLKKAVPFHWDEVAQCSFEASVETELKFLPYKQFFGYPGIFVIFESI
jgi:hypothetical protein